MELQAGKKYRTKYGIGRAVDSDLFTNYIALYFDDVVGDDGRPIYYVKSQGGISNVGWITDKYDVTGEYTEQE